MLAERYFRWSLRWERYTRSMPVRLGLMVQAKNWITVLKRNGEQREELRPWVKRLAKKRKSYFGEILFSGYLNLLADSIISSITLKRFMGRFQEKTTGTFLMM